MNRNSIADVDKRYIYSEIEYYAVFCTYRKRKVFCEDDVVCRFSELANICLKEMECELLSLTVELDHVVLRIKANASLSPTSIFFTLRYNTSSVMRREFDFLKKASALWDRGLLISTEPIKDELYFRFLDERKRKNQKKSVQKT